MIHRINLNKPAIPDEFKQHLKIKNNKIFSKFGAPHYCIHHKSEHQFIEVSNNLSEFKKYNLTPDNIHLDNIINQHHSVVSCLRSGIEEISYLHPGFSYNLDSHLIKLEHQSLVEDQTVWTDTDHESRVNFFHQLKKEVNDSQADGILFSSGVDSLLIALLDDCDRVLYTWDSEPFQTEFACHMAKKLNKKIKILPFVEKNDEKISQKLRNNYLGHYQSWLSGIANIKDIYGLSLISGQNADALLSVDNFSPGFNMIGFRRLLNLCKSSIHRLAYTSEFQKILPTNYQNTLKVATLNKFFLSNDEHVIADYFMLYYKKTQNFTKDYGLYLGPENKNNFISAIKISKYCRYIVNVMRLYTEIYQTSGLKIVLPFSSPNIMKSLVNYSPSWKDLFHPKNMFYEYVKKSGIEYFQDKYNLLRRKLSVKHYLNRAFNRKSFIRGNQAIDLIKNECNLLDLDFQLEQKKLSISDLSEKRNLMVFDRYLNTLRFKRNYFS